MYRIFAIVDRSNVILIQMDSGMMNSSKLKNLTYNTNKPI